MPPRRRPPREAAAGTALSQLRHRPPALTPEALGLPLAAFPSWFLRIICDRCGGIIMHNEVRLPERQRGMILRVLLSRMRHEGCGGKAGRAELLTSIDDVSSHPVRRIVLRAG
jgi:hypothetical protein